MLELIMKTSERTGRSAEEVKKFIIAAKREAVKKGFKAGSPSYFHFIDKKMKSLESDEVLELKPMMQPAGKPKRKR